MAAHEAAKVLVLYAGGTIGMLNTEKGYVPEKGYLSRYLRSQTRFHDPLRDSVFSNSSSAASFRAWHAANLSPQPSRPPSPLKEDEHEHKLLVRTCARKLHDSQVAECWEDSLLTPPIDKTGRRLRFTILEYEPLLDSSNMSMEDWIRLATDIELNYAAFDGFIILHGTDTMAYTSSALSFLLQDLGKTVIVTGAQIPLGELRNDAVDNFLGSLILAGGYIIPEVSLYFGHRLFRGNRARKVSSLEFGAFASPNMDPLGTVGINVEIDWSLVFRPTRLKTFRAHKRMNENVSILQLFPGIPASTVRTFLSAPMQGVILETFGAGNPPQRKDLMDAIKEACDRGVVIVNISQCPRGSVSPVYAGGRELVDAGVVAGQDMTPECALTKLSYLLSKPSLSVERVRELMASPLRGELSIPNLAATAPLQGQSTSLSGLLSQLIHLISGETLPSGVTEADRASTADSTAAWTSTQRDSTLVETALAPYLLSLAAARNDKEAMQHLLASVVALDGAKAHTGSATVHLQQQVSGIVNAVDPASGRNALHTASMAGSTDCVKLLLGAGALVHLRDTLGHTALYYAARGGHRECVEILRNAGAHLGGYDISRGKINLANGSDAQGLWKLAGAM